MADDERWIMLLYGVALTDEQAAALERQMIVGAASGDDDRLAALLNRTFRCSGSAWLSTVRDRRSHRLYVGVALADVQCGADGDEWATAASADDDDFRQARRLMRRRDLLDALQAVMGDKCSPSLHMFVQQQ